MMVGEGPSQAVAFISPKWENAHAARTGVVALVLQGVVVHGHH